MNITTIPGNSNSDITTIQGSVYADMISIENNKLYVNSLEGRDTITSGTGTEDLVIDSGTNDDTVNFTAEVLTSTILLGSGEDSLVIKDFSGSIYGGTGNDSITHIGSRTVSNTLFEEKAEMTQ